MPAQKFAPSSPAPRCPALPALLALALALAAGGCAGKPKHPKPPKPWIGTKSLLTFPMVRTTQPPKSPDALEDALEAGWRSRMKAPEDEFVRVQGGKFPKVQTMSIDLTDAYIAMDDDKKKLRPKGKPQGTIKVESLEFVAKPLKVEKANLILDMRAADATLEVRRDRRGRQMLTLTGARDGAVSLEVARKDIEWLLLKSAREGAGKFGVSVDRIKLKLDVIENRTIRGDLKLDTRLGFLPAGLRFKARVDIDDNLNGRITNLSCSGDQLLGPLISAVVHPALQRYEGKTRPLVGFAWGNLRLRDLRMWSDEKIGIGLAAKFGDDTSPPRPTKFRKRQQAEMVASK